MLLCLQRIFRAPRLLISVLLRLQICTTPLALQTSMIPHRHICNRSYSASNFHTFTPLYLYCTSKVRATHTYIRSRLHWVSRAAMIHNPYLHTFTLLHLKRASRAVYLHTSKSPHLQYAFRAAHHHTCTSTYPQYSTSMPSQRYVCDSPPELNVIMLLYTAIGFQHSYVFHNFTLLDLQHV